MIKQRFKTIHEKNRVIDNIINSLVHRKSFLVCGHTSPDEDCISSMVAFSLLINRFDKQSQIYISDRVPDNIDYLLQICKYNSIKILKKKSKITANIDTVVICDTPKGSMLDTNRGIDKLLNSKNIIKIEIDHHTGGDSDYIGDEGYCLVTDASSTAELIGLIALKLNKRKDILSKFMISDPFSRNFVLSIVTGIVGDTNMGKFLKSKSERKYYEIFSKLYNNILMKTTIKETNISRIDEVFHELQKHTEMEEKCYTYIFNKHKISNSIGYVILNREDMKYLLKEFDEDTIITVSRSIANELAEKSKRLSLVAYYDSDKISNFIQFRMRRSHEFKTFDLRKILEKFSIENGGGHEGAIGFRFPKESIDDLEKYTTKFIKKVEKTIS
jgi:nanoRNase/pAp phosphatase (c-di-AMP/oligoRNAs hydrolase)